MGRFGSLKVPSRLGTERVVSGVGRGGRGTEYVSSAVGEGRKEDENANDDIIVWSVKKIYQLIEQE